MHPARVRSLLVALLSCAALSSACNRVSSTAAPDAAGSGAPSSSAPVSTVPGPLANLALTFSTRGIRGVTRYALTPDRALTVSAGADAGATRVKLSARELAALDALLRSAGFSDAMKPSRAEIGDVDRYDVHVTSTTFNADGSGYILDSREYTTPPAIRSLMAELDKLRALATAPRVRTFALLFTRVEQGGTAGKVEVFDVRSDGTAVRRDQSNRVLQSGTASDDDLAPLSRLLASPELAALGPAFVDPTPPPGMMEVDYAIDISKTTKLSGVFHEKTPPVIGALTSEVMSVVLHASPAAPRDGG